jgi:hypothetical protein
MRVRLSLDFDILIESFISLCIIETVGAQVLVDRILPLFLEHRFFFHVNNILQLSMYHWMTYIQ